MDITKIIVGKNIPHDFNVIIEIPANSLPVKYELDKHSGAIVVDRFITTAMCYPVNYGFIPHTLSQDNDPTDVLVLTPYPVVVGSVINCRALGILEMEDESGIDAKILALPAKKICQMYEDIETIEQLPKLLIEQIKHYFEHYKDLERGKWVKINTWGDINAAHKEIIESRERYLKI